MHISSRSVRIIAAAFIAVVMVGASVWFTNTTPKRASALSTDELLRAYVEQDTDGDGLPDWQEEVYGTDPANPQSVQAGMTDAEAVATGVVQPAFLSEEVPDPITDADIPVDAPSANSLTDRFSRQFIEEYFAAGGGKNVSEEEQARIIEGLITTFAREAEASLGSSYTEISLQVRNDLAVKEYIETLEGFLLNTLPTENSDMPALAQLYIERSDMKAQERLVALSQIYGNMANGLLAIPVPRSLVTEHLQLLRAYDRVSKAGATLARYEEDPVAALGALSIFIPARNDIVGAFSGYATEILKDGEPGEGEPGALTVEFVRAQERQ